MIQNSTSLIYGQCHTLIPQKSVDNVGKRYGFTINVTYDKQQFMKDIDIDHKSYGWHIFVHETVHKFDGMFDL